MITDGKQTTTLPYTRLSVASRAIKNKGVTVYAIGVGLGADRGELEDIVSAHSQSPINGDAFRTYQDFLIPSGSLYGGGFPSLSASAIADIRGADTLHYSKFERQLRCKVASVYRLMQMFGWGKGVFDRAACTVWNHNKSVSQEVSCFIVSNIYY